MFDKKCSSIESFLIKLFFLIYYFQARQSESKENEPMVKIESTKESAAAKAEREREEAALLCSLENPDSCLMCSGWAKKKNNPIHIQEKKIHFSLWKTLYMLLCNYFLPKTMPANEL